MRRGAVWGLAIAAGLGLVGCREAPEEASIVGGETAKIEVTSPAFAHEGDIPARYTCNGENVSPPLAWQPGPTGTVSYALVADDPDAPLGTWVHWVAWNITATSLAEAIQAGALMTPAQGTNSGKKLGYSGPCPPRPTGTHRYYFKVYALDTDLNLPPTATKKELLAAMEGHVLAQGELMGRYRQP